MAKSKKITIGTILKAMNLEEERQIVVTCGTGEDTVEIPVKPRLSLSERMNMVNDIADIVFMSGDDGEVVYCPAFKRFAIEYEIVNYFTDISLPASTEKAREFLEKTNIASTIAGALRDGYIGGIVADANELIEYRKQAALKSSKLDSIFDSAVGVIKAVNEKIESTDLTQIMEYIKKNVPELAESMFVGEQATEIAAV